MGVLSDHKKNGQKLIPPIYKIGNFYDVSWVKDVIPEIIWVALVNDKLGWKDSCSTIAHLCSIAMEVNNKNNYAFISSYNKLTKDEQAEISNRIKYSGLFTKLDYSLFNFIEFFPKCPLSLIYNNSFPQKIIDVKFIINYKKILGSIYDKTSPESTFLLTSVIYSMLSTRKLNIHTNSPLANLEEIKDYPNSDISKRIAGSQRAIINNFFNNQIYSKDENWNKYFWNTGISLEPCKI